MAVYKIDCCRYCVPPERYPGCHDRCSKYKWQKEALKQQKEETKKLMHPQISRYDFSKIGYADYNSRRRQRRKNR